MWEDLLVWALRRYIVPGHLEITLPSGRVETFSGAAGPRVAARVTDPDLPRKMLLNTEVALGEAYMDGTMVIEGDDLKGFLQLVIGATPRSNWSPIPLLTRASKAWMKLSTFNPVHRARANVAHHYDISPELYGLFLDPNKQYTCAYFYKPGITLEEAQAAKMAHIARKLLITPGMRVLDIGCGFGTLAIYLAKNFGARVVGVTLSEVQLNEARQRAKAEGVAHLTEFRMQDYRLVNETFDRIVSIGMMEHVGLRHLGTYFDKVHAMLAPDGVALIHYIARPLQPEPNSPWFEKYIFPGSYCPAISEVSPHLAKAGLILDDLEAWRGHYDPTLAGWRENFEANLPRVRELTDDRFIRMWRFYLLSAEITFAYGLLTIHQLQLSRRQDAVPKARDYLYPSGPARESRDTRPGNFAQPKRPHEVREGVDLFGRAGHLEDETFKGRVHNIRTENLG